MREEPECLRSVIVEAKQKASSVTLNWGEDTDCWEVEIITHKPFRGCQPMLADAINEALYAAGKKEVKR